MKLSIHIRWLLLINHVNFTKKGSVISKQKSRSYSETKIDYPDSDLDPNKGKDNSLRLSDTTYNAPKVSCISEVLGGNQMGLFVEVTRSATVAEARLQLTHQPSILE